MVTAYNTLEPAEMQCQSLLIYAQALTNKFPSRSTRMTYIEGGKRKEEVLSKEDEDAEQKTYEAFLGGFPLKKKALGKKKDGSK